MAGLGSGLVKILGLRLIVSIRSLIECPGRFSDQSSVSCQDSYGRLGVKFQFECWISGRDSRSYPMLGLGIGSRLNVESRVGIRESGPGV